MAVPAQQFRFNFQQPNIVDPEKVLAPPAASAPAVSTSRALFRVLEQQVARRLEEKDRELENARRRKEDLEEKLKRMSGENHMWFNLAKKKEAMVCSLEQVLLHLHLQGKNNTSDYDGSVGFPADDARSCCFEERGEKEELRWRKACKVCLEREVSVLLLPCRHLCLCKECESRMETCPICKAIKNASLQIFMPQSHLNSDSQILRTQQSESGLACMHEPLQLSSSVKLMERVRIP